MVPGKTGTLISELFLKSQCSLKTKLLETCGFTAARCWLFSKSHIRYSSFLASLDSDLYSESLIGRPGVTFTVRFIPSH